MDNSFISLENKNILITGVSRSLGIGATLAKMFAEAGANVIVHGYSTYDKELDYPDASSDFVFDLKRKLSEKEYNIKVLPQSDLSLKGEAEKIVRNAKIIYGRLDGLILNHAYSVNTPLFNWTEEHIDKHFNINVRTCMLMSQEFARQISKDGGAITLFTGGQYLGPMIDELAYATSKEAIRNLSKQLSDALASRKIRVNCVNSGPTDTGWANKKVYEEIKKKFPYKRWGNPEDVTRLVLFLHSEYSNWITGQIIATEGGFQR